MKLVKSLLLGSAAGLVAVASAQAADLPTRKAAPAEYVRICDAYGAGFFYIPGTETCMRISGMVRAQYVWSNTRSTNTTPGSLASVVSARAIDNIGIRARGRLNVDTRTQTSWGTLRSYFRFEGTHNTAYGPNSFYTGGDQFRPTYAFIQFAGITAGRAQSFFDFYANNFSWGTAARNSDIQTNLLAYTATFGGGFSATVGIESPADNQFVAVLPTGSVAGVYNAATARAAGVRYPDVVGALRVDQGWGSAQLSGAYGRRQTFASTGVGAFHKDFNIWAVKGGVKINLPMLAAGDQLWIEATYSRGALERLGWSGNNGGGNENGWRTGYVGVNSGAVAYQPVGTIGYKFGTGKGWSVMAALQHYWTPSFRSVLAASYLDWSYDTALRTMGYAKLKEWRVGHQLIWSPVKDFDIGVEVLYAKLNQSVSAPMSAAIRAAGLKKDPDTIEARVRLQRNF